MAKSKKPATEVEGHAIQQPRSLDAANEREVTRRNDEHIQSLAESDAREAERIRRKRSGKND